MHSARKDPWNGGLQCVGMSHDVSLSYFVCFEFGLTCLYFLFQEIDLWRVHFHPPCLRRIGALGRIAPGLRRANKQARMSLNKVGEQECLHRVLISCVLLLGAAFEPSGDTAWRRPLVTVWNCAARSAWHAQHLVQRVLAA